MPTFSGLEATYTATRLRFLVHHLNLKFMLVAIMMYLTQVLVYFETRLSIIKNIYKTRAALSIYWHWG